MFRPRSAILTLYGDYVRQRGGEVGIGSLIKIFSNFGLSEQSIRSAVSRMCRAGLLKVRRKRTKSFYSLTKDASNLIDRGTKRIFERKSNHWNGYWSIVVYYIPEKKRQARDRLRQELHWMGYGPLSEATWISPHDLTREVAEMADNLKIKENVQVFQAKYIGFSESEKIVSRCWDLNNIHNKYAKFITKYKPKLVDHVNRLQKGYTIESSNCFVERFNLIEEYRRLPFFDPDLPEELLPEKWLRPQAATLFNEYYDSLTEKANEYFDSVSKSYRGTRKAKIEEHKGTDEKPHRSRNPNSSFLL